MQRYPLISSTQVAPKAQGEDWHSLISTREGEETKRSYSILLFCQKKLTADLPTVALRHIPVSAQRWIRISSTGIISEPVL